MRNRRDEGGSTAGICGPCLESPPGPASIHGRRGLIPPNPGRAKDVRGPGL